MPISRASAVEFISRACGEAEALGFNQSSLVVDHVCYRTASTLEYQEVKSALCARALEGLEATLLSETEVNGRPIATFLLDEPFAVGNRLVSALEVPAPKFGTSYESGFEHIEYVISESFEAFQAFYPAVQFERSAVNQALNPEISVKISSGKIKFHHLPLAGIIALEGLIDARLLEINEHARLPLRPVLNGQSIKLRPMKPADFESLYRVAMDPELWKQHSEPQRYVKENFLKFFDKTLKSGGALVVETTSNREIIGSTRFYDLNHIDRSIVAGYTFLGRAYWGGMVNREIKNLMLTYAFCFVDTVIFQTSESNYRARASLAKLGAVQKSGVHEIPGIGPRLEFVMTKDKWLELNNIRRK